MVRERQEFIGLGLIRKPDEDHQRIAAARAAYCAFAFAIAARWIARTMLIEGWADFISSQTRAQVGPVDDGLQHLAERREWSRRG